VNDVKEDSAQHKERWPEGREVHVQQVLPRHLVCSELWILSTSTAGHMARQLWQVITVQHGVWEVCKLRVEDQVELIQRVFHLAILINGTETVFSMLHLSWLPNLRQASVKIL